MKEESYYTAIFMVTQENKMYLCMDVIINKNLKSAEFFH
jgi:hypothetical protein